MAVRVEFYGIPRHRAGVAFCEVEATNLGEVFAEVVRTVPQLAESCFNGNQLQSGYLANINGKTFTTDPETPLESGDSVLILSADVGG